MIYIFKYETDSRKVKKGQTFIAIKGFTHDGHNFINEAIINGANHIICEKDLDILIPYTKVTNTSEYLKKILKNDYKKIIDKLNIIGITGTNGKTTSAYITYQMLNLFDKKCAYIGTLGYINQNENIHLDNTTPDILNVYKLLIHSYEQGINYIVMEVSSHSLSMDRLYGIDFNIACFTNLTIDHLDYHKDMTDYLESKLMILKHLKEDAITIYNSDDEKGYKFKKENHKFYTYGYSGDFKIINYNLNINKIKLSFKFNNYNYSVTIPLSSSFNVYNYLLMVSILYSLDINIKDIINNTYKINAPNGRCETYKIKNGYAIIDYAHTPDAIEKIIISYNKIRKGRLITLFGCGGNRDKSKRPIMGNIAATLSDYVIITSDNPRYENELDIIKDIVKGIKKSNYKIIPNRCDAIKEAIKLINKDDILLVLGKGHEEYQIILNNKFHFSDKEEILKAV